MNKHIGNSPGTQVRAEGELVWNLWLNTKEKKKSPDSPHLKHSPTETKGQAINWYI